MAVRGIVLGNPGNGQVIKPKTLGFNMTDFMSRGVIAEADNGEEIRIQDVTLKIYRIIDKLDIILLIGVGLVGVSTIIQVVNLLK